MANANRHSVIFGVCYCRNLSPTSSPGPGLSGEAMDPAQSFRKKCDTSWLTARQFFERNRSSVIRIRLFAPKKNYVSTKAPSDSRPASASHICKEGVTKTTKTWYWRAACKHCSVRSILTSSFACTINLYGYCLSDARWLLEWMNLCGFEYLCLILLQYVLLLPYSLQ
jgi:hypothetical protein